MKRFFYLSLLSLLCVAQVVRAEDAAAVAARQEADENFKILKANISDLTDANAVLQKRIESLEKEIAELRSKLAKPAGNFATPDDIKRLEEAIQEVDKKRVEDYKKMKEILSDLGKSLSHSGGHVKEPQPIDDGPAPTANPDQPTFTYIVKEGDYLSTIAKAYREKGVNVTVDQILKANPGLKANALVPRMKILIPDTRVSANNKTDTK